MAPEVKMEEKGVTSCNQMVPGVIKTEDKMEDFGDNPVSQYRVTVEI